MRYTKNNAMPAIAAVAGGKISLSHKATLHGFEDYKGSSEREGRGGGRDRGPRGGGFGGRDRGPRGSGFGGRDRDRGGRDRR